MSRNQNRLGNARGSISVQFLVILVPVVFGMMGFAIDLGRLYLIRGELNQAASAMALAAAAQLNGTTAATGSANAAALATIDAAQGNSNKYNFGSVLPGVGTGFLTSDSPTLSYFSTAADAIAAFGQTGAASGGDGAPRYVTVNLAADAPLLFWSLLSLGQSRKTSVAASAVAGVSAPVCTACGIEPFAVAPINPTDTQDFGFLAGTFYTLAFQCTGAAGADGPIAGTASRVLYAIINRLDAGSSFAEDQQLFRDGAQGLTPSTTSAQACSTIGGPPETLWASTQPPRACNVTTAPNAFLEDAMCGLSSRLSNTIPDACQANADFGTVAPAYSQDSDITSVIDLTSAPDYTTYTGNNRRLLTLPIVDSLTTLNVIAFRQFLLVPTPGTTPLANNPADPGGRFVVVYAGIVAPVKQGRFDGACAITSGPGKVVLHQ